MKGCGVESGSSGSGSADQTSSLIVLTSATSGSAERLMRATTE
jgi:hypothetical protein